MKSLTVGVLTTAFVFGLGEDVMHAQKWPSSVPLGDVARQLKAQRAKSGKQPRLFTNDDVIALRAAGEQAQTLVASAANSKQAPPEEQTGQQAGANQTAKAAAQAIPVDMSLEAPSAEDYIDRMSKVQVAGEGKRKAAGSSSTAAKLAFHPIPPSGQAGSGQVTPGAAITPAGEWAKAKFRAASGAASTSGEPGPIAGPSVMVQTPPREDLGYVERADGQVEAIVAVGEHIGLIEETKAFIKSFHIPAPSPAEVEMALAQPPAANPAEAAAPEAGQAPPNPPAEEGGVEVAQAQAAPGQPAGGENGGTPPETTLQQEPLADYNGDLPGAQPPAQLEPPLAPVPPPAIPDETLSRSTVSPLGYVEKAGGELEAIVAFREQVYLVHEGERFADRFRVLRVTPVAVEIVQELTEASSGAPDRKRHTDRPPDPH